MFQDMASVTEGIPSIIEPCIMKMINHASKENIKHTLQKFGLHPCSSGCMRFSRR
jgi:hypothetical protein